MINQVVLHSSLLFGQFIGLLLVLHHSDGLAPLVVTGNSSNVQKLFRRYLSTIIHVKNWYENDPFDENSKSYKSLKHVRSLHKNVSNSMNDKSGRVEGKDRLWIPQYGMCYAQFSFIGFVALYPKECGLHSLSKEDFDSLLYFWRVIGYCLGTDDRFNLCSGTSQEVVQLCQLIYWRDWYPLLISEPLVCPEGEEMAKGICLAMNKLSKFIHWNVLMKYWYPILNVSKTIELQSISERFWYYFIKFMMTSATKLSIGRICLTFGARLNIWITTKLKSYKYEALKKQYPNFSFDNKSCPFDVHFKYVDVFEAVEEKTNQYKS